MLDNLDFIKTQTDKCVYCGMCSDVCPTYRLSRREPESPRGRVLAIKQVAAGTLTPTARFLKNIHHCLLCGRCDAICPAHIPITSLVHHIKVSHPSKGIQKYLWATKHSHRLKKWFGLGSLVSKQLRIPKQMRLPTKPKKMRLQNAAPLGLFTGCTGNTFDRETKQACISLLHKKNTPLAIPKGQQCCGTLHHHAGNQDDFDHLQKQNIHAIQQAGITHYLYFLTGCRFGIEQLGQQAGIQTSEITAYLAGLDWSTFRFAPLPTTILIHLPCSATTDSKQHLESLLGLIPELRWQWLNDVGPCCGSAGSHMVQFPERADALREPFVTAINQHAQTVEKAWVLTNNIGCRLHLARGQLASNVIMAHPVALLDQQLT